MKILKYFLVLLVIVAIVFFGSGLLTPSVTYESEISVNKPVKEAWSVLSDESKVKDWIEGYKRSELVSGTPNTVGATSNVYVDNQGQEMMMTETITEFIPHKKMAMTFTMDFMDMDYEMTLNESNGKTNIKSTSTTKGNSLFAKSLMSFMKSGMKAQEDANMARLEKVINNNTTDYFQETN